MKQMKRTGIYKSKNVSFDPIKCEAHSYDWWRFVAKVENKVVFNNYYYSSTTRKHQLKVKQLLNDLNIKIDIEAPFPKGITQLDMSSLKSLIITAEENLCDKFLAEELKREERNEKSKRNRLVKKIKNKLENEMHFRDYEIKPRSQFGLYNKIAVHQIVEPSSFNHDIENAIHNFSRDGFSSVVLYV